MFLRRMTCLDRSRRVHEAVAETTNNRRHAVVAVRPRVWSARSGVRRIPHGARHNWTAVGGRHTGRVGDQAAVRAPIGDRRRMGRVAGRDITPAKNERVSTGSVPQGRNRDRTQLWLERSANCGPYIRSQLEPGMPEDLVYLALIEADSVGREIARLGGGDVAVHRRDRPPTDSGSIATLTSGGIRSGRRRRRSITCRSCTGSSGAGTWRRPRTIRARVGWSGPSAGMRAAAVATMRCSGGSTSTFRGRRAITSR